MAVDVHSIWSFADAAGSEARFRAALDSSVPKDQGVLWTQIARAQGLQGRWQEAEESLEQALLVAGDQPEVRVRYHLESGRLKFSVAHNPDEVSPEDEQRAREHYSQAFELGKAHRFDYLAVDALHMLAVVERDVEDQVIANYRAVNYMAECDTADARRWEGSLRHNLGYTLHSLGRDDEAIVQYQQSLKAREEAGNASGVRIAKWMIARSLRAMGDLSEALSMQRALQKELEAVGETDSYVDEEISILEGMLQRD